MSEEKKVNIIVLVPAGRLPLDIMAAAHRLAEQYGLGVYLTAVQNLRLTGVPQEIAPAIKKELASLGATFKGPGKFLLPKVCAGAEQCNLAVIDTVAMNQKILDKFGDLPNVKAKVKMAISGCPISCSNPKITDIGLMATKKGYEVFVGGKGGPSPKIGKRIAKGADEERVLEIIGELVAFHNRKTEKKQRMFTLLEDSEFPFAEV
ncbi:nitrite reductase [Desulfogranum marinum]|jgi:sulfite reductase beta subunit-like hemoprotein|uniref:nitrite reductase n=1 Tax=Desulfogranum marinum TaxID=453220 RepID=UPI001964D1F8|nr:nitrite reductase [Desulfogranum marinum]MBM9513337.1 nitrite reductase [Desulfogranum marinum]